MLKEGEVLVSFKAQKELRDAFNEALKKLDMNASQVLRKAMRETIEKAEEKK